MVRSIFASELARCCAMRMGWHRLVDRRDRVAGAHNPRACPGHRDNASGPHVRWGASVPRAPRMLQATARIAIPKVTSTLSGERLLSSKLIGMAYWPLWAQSTSSQSETVDVQDEVSQRHVPDVGFTSETGRKACEDRRLSYDRCCAHTVRSRCGHGRQQPLRSRLPPIVVWLRLAPVIQY